MPSACSSVIAGAPGIVGAGIKVPVSGGRFVPYANLDYAASAPCLAAVQHAVAEALPYYSSVHRGAGYASQLTTARYEQARQTVREFLGARGSDAVIFTRNTTDAMNLLAQALPEGASVVVFESEHHAALLPWGRRHRTIRLPVPPSAAAAVPAVEAAFAAAPAGPLAAAEPYLFGGAATAVVAADSVTWAEDPEQRQEAGTPNVLGAIAIAAACDALSNWAPLVAEEERLLRRLRGGLAALATLPAHRPVAVGAVP